MSPHVVITAPHRCGPRLPRQALEEQNLFFIQNSQETEHALDELKQNFGKVQKTMDTKTQVRPKYSTCVYTYLLCAVS